MTESSEQNHDQSSDQNNKKLFQKGGLPGPGRGKKKPLKPITLLEVSAELEADLRSKDHKIRHSAVKLFLALRKQTGETGNNPAISPQVQAALQGYTTDLFDDGIVEAGEDDITN